MYRSLVVTHSHNNICDRKENNTLCAHSISFKYQELSWIKNQPWGSSAHFDSLAHCNCSGLHRYMLLARMCVGASMWDCSIVYYWSLYVKLYTVASLCYTIASLCITVNQIHGSGFPDRHGSWVGLLRPEHGEGWWGSQCEQRIKWWGESHVWSMATLLEREQVWRASKWKQVWPIQ
jgi:hypothetical protein